MFSRNSIVSLVSIFCLALAPAWPALSLTYPGCKEVTNADFKATTLVSRAQDTLLEPMKMAFDLVAQAGEDAKDKVDIYFTERYGKIRKYDARQKKVVTLGKLGLMYNGRYVSDFANTSDGLLGIVLDPGFKSNHFLYLYYSFKSATDSSWRVSRFTLDSSNQRLDVNSEKVVLSIPTVLGSKHPGGALQFDDRGDLWITTGNDYNPLGPDPYPVWSSPNTNDLRGKILRIHPMPDGSYTIPAGNLFPQGTPKTKPEIYVMGCRNPYTLGVDRMTHWITWGDVGPDDTSMDGTSINKVASDKTEEQDLATGPGNYGYPFFVGANFVLKKGIDPSKPVLPKNALWVGNAARGLDTLPPALPAIRPYHRSCAITGPIYRYDPELNSSIKLPPHFEGKWFVTDFTRSSIEIVNVSGEGKKEISEDTILQNIALSYPLDFQQGPDGALYVSNYGSKTRGLSVLATLMRIEYTGDCRPNTLAAKRLAAPAGPQVEIIQARNLSLSMRGMREFSIEVRDLSGRPVASRQGRGDTRLDLPEVRARGIYFLSVVSPQGRVDRKILKE